MAFQNIFGIIAYQVTDTTPTNRFQEENRKTGDVDENVNFANFQDLTPEMLFGVRLSTAPILVQENDEAASGFCPSPENQIPFIGGIMLKS